LPSKRLNDNTIVMMLNDEGNGESANICPFLAAIISAILFIYFLKILNSGVELP